MSPETVRAVHLDSLPGGPIEEIVDTELADELDAVMIVCAHHINHAGEPGVPDVEPDGWLTEPFLDELVEHMAEGGMPNYAPDDLEELLGRVLDRFGTEVTIDA